MPWYLCHNGRDELGSRHTLRNTIFASGDIHSRLIYWYGRQVERYFHYERQDDGVYCLWVITADALQGGVLLCEHRATNGHIASLMEGDIALMHAGEEDDDNNDCTNNNDIVIIDNNNFNNNNDNIDHDKNGEDKENNNNNNNNNNIVGVDDDDNNNDD